VSILWKSWKDKIIDFFYKEIEEEMDMKDLKVKAQSSSTAENRSVETKVAYQYPKNLKPPFRFPIIPDQQQNEDPVMKRQAKKRKQTKNKDQQVERDRVTHGYERKKAQKVLEDVPAYVRRQKLAPPTEEKQEDSVKEQVKFPDTPIMNHTRPEELDEVFRKRDGVLNKVETGLAHVVPQTEETESQTDQPEKQPKKMEPLHQVEVKQEPKQPKQQDTLDLPQENDLNNQMNEAQAEIAATKQMTQTRSTIKTEPITKAVPNYLLNDPVEPGTDDEDWLIEQQILLEDTLEHFHIDATVVNVTQGPAVTRFEIQPALGVKVSKIRNLADDIKLNLAAKDIRIEAPIPGKNTIGIEVPNQYPQFVTLQKIIETEAFKSATSPLTIALGLTIEGEALITDIEKMPHGLIAGATGSGKSVCINTIILSLLYKAHYEEVKFLLIDPKMVELTPYQSIPHLIAPVITDVKAATVALKWAVEEMEARYEKFVEAGVRNIKKYNEKSVEKLPYIVIIIDELADLMMVSPQEVEDAICRIAQKARAAGMHLLLATQRPSVDVITGLIKANIPTRIAFSVSSQVDSRTMLDANGAEKLLGKGDMLFVENGANKAVRLQGPFVSDEEIDRVASYMRSIAKPNYVFEQDQLLLEVEQEAEDELLIDVMKFVVMENQASTSLLQRRFRIGYNRAARLIDSLEQRGIISGQNGSKPREILIHKTQLNDLI
jgi:S-DNA-T family DNA segregation ATPase FtsK/SpoIIIE